MTRCLAKAGVSWARRQVSKLMAWAAWKHKDYGVRYNYFNDYYFASIIIALFENILPFLTKLTERLLGANSLESLVVLVLWLTN